jgi:protein-disulfide isomerase
MNSTRSINPKVIYRSKLVKSVINLSLISIAMLTAHLKAYAQQQERAASQLNTDIETLKHDVNKLADAQNKISNQLDDLKLLLATDSKPQTMPQPNAQPLKLNVHQEHYRGESAARFAIIEYSDFECPFCGQYERATYPQIFDAYIKTGKAKLYYRDLPLARHPHAMLAARAARCAGEQGKYWEMHDNLFANQTSLNQKDISDRAQFLALDAGKLSECLSSERYKDDIRESISEAQKLGVNGTPTFFLGAIGPNGDVSNIREIVGARPYADFQSALDELLASKTPEAVSAH